MTVYGRDFRSLRAWRGSQDQAFEELCYQLRDRTPDGAELVKTGNPDAGLEWYVELPNGVQWGWQAKFTFDVDTLLKLMEKSLRTVVQRRPKCRRLTFCIPFDLPDAPREGGWKSARQKFEDRKKSWRRQIPHADRVRIELWSEGDLLQRLVGHPSQRGVEWFFWNREIFSLDWCAERVATTVRAADRRYTPELHVDLPVAFALEGLARSDVYWQKYRALRGAVVIAAAKIDVSHSTGIGVTTQVRNLVRCLTKWRQEVPNHVTLPARLDRGRVLAVTREVHDAADVAYPSDPPRRQRKPTRRQVRTRERRSVLRHYLRTLNRALSAFENLLKSGASEAAERGALLLTGEAGQGKTHLFCAAAERAAAARQPAIVILAGRLSGRNVWSEIANLLGLGHVGSEVLIGAMQAAAQASNSPFLLLIDALNEADEPKAWQEELPSLLAEINRSSWISLGVSVRSTFRSIVLPAGGVSGIADIEHRGFEHRELEATERFFDAFGLDQPRVPLLMPEFSNPLFLKLYCEGLEGLGLSAPPTGETHASDVFDRYLQAKAARIESRLDLDPGTRPVETAIDSFCRALAHENRDSLERERSTKIINQFAAGRNKWPDTLLGQLLSEGVLTADLAWRRATDDPVEVIRITYQRFADYRVASALLESSKGDPERLREALVAGSPLRGQVLKAPAGWIEALAVKIPERFNVELLDAARWHLDSFTRRRWNLAFVNSVATRRASAVTDRTRVLLSRVARRSRDLNGLVRETLLTVALIPEHPLRDALHERLKSWTMPTRDVAWSIPTYFAFDSGGLLDRLIRWAARGPYPDCPDEVVATAATPIVWTFTSPNRWMRDYATKALAQLLSGHLPVLPPLIRQFDGVDDPYVIERLAAVSHGAVLRGGRHAPEAAVAVAGELKRAALANAHIPNIITRDAVRGVFEWCSEQELIEDHEYAEVLPPYGTAPPGRPRTKKQIESAYRRDEHHRAQVGWPYATVFASILGMLDDFGHYVIASKVSDFSQHPLSSARPQQGEMTPYQTESAKCWVFERVLSLGWTPERFAEFDRVHTDHWAGRSDHKAERFGKKYQWIALRELLARIADNVHMAAEIEYAGPWQFFGRDIDPTLPAPRRRRSDDDGFDLEPTFSSDSETWWIPQGPTYGPDDPPVGEGWAVAVGDIPEFEPLVSRKGPDGVRWVALHSFHDWNEAVSEDEDRWAQRRRNLWSHIYSWLVRPADLNACIAHIKQRSLWGRWMPEGMKHTVAGYLGELPWAEAAREPTDQWQGIRGGIGFKPIGIDVYPTWAEYHWEGNNLDCSIEHGVHAFFPAPVLFEAGKLRWVPGNRAWCRPDGTLVARYDDAPGHGALQVREDWLKQVLRKTGHAVVFGWLGEKRLIEAGLATGLVGDWTVIDAVASFKDGRWTFGQRRLKRRSVRG